MQPMNDADFMTLMAAIEALNDANARAAEWERYAHEVEANRDQWVNHANNLEAEAKDLADKLGVERAHSTGLKAVVDSFKVAHPDSPLLEQAGAAFKSPEVAGVPKRRYHMLYESAFDHEAKKNGITNPASRRYN